MNFGQLVSPDKKILLTSIKNTVGRHPDNIIILKHSSISKFHCSIDFDDDNNAYLLDFGSLNGVSLNGMKIPPQKRIDIRTGSLIRFGNDMDVFKFVNFGGQAEEKRFDDVHNVTVEGNGIFTLGQQRDEPTREILTSKNMEKSSIDVSQNKPRDIFASANSNLHELNSELEALQRKNRESERQLEECTLSLKEKEVEFQKKQLFESEKSSKKGALEGLIMEMQKKYTELEQSNEEKQDQIDELCHKDWARNMETLKLEQKHLERILKEKESELSNIKKYASSLMHGGAGSPNILMLEEQGKELSLLKRQLVQYQNRNNECQRRWKDLYDENVRKDDHLKGLQLQLERQSQLYQQLYTEFDRKYFQAQSQVASILKGSNQNIVDLASDFLVNQIQNIQLESEEFQQENNDLRGNYEDLTTEVDKLENQKDYFESAFKKNNVRDDNNLAALRNLRTRILELIDLGEEMKLFSSGQEKQDLENLRAFLDDKLVQILNKNNSLAEKINDINKFNGNADEGNTINFFAELLEEKERKVEILTKELELQSLRSSKTNEDIQILQNRLKALTGMCFGTQNIVSNARHRRRPKVDKRYRIQKDQLPPL